MNKKKSLISVFITIIIIITLTPEIKSLKIEKSKNLEIFKQDNTLDNCKCKNSIEKELDYKKQNNYFLGLLKGGDILPLGKEFTGKVPSSWDWRNHEGEDWTTNIKDQGLCGCCYAFGLYSAMESCIKIKSNKPNFYIDLSEQFMVSCGTIWTSGIFGCEGAYMSSILDFIETYGAIPESCFPYESGSGYLPPCSDKCQDWEELPRSHCSFSRPSQDRTACPCSVWEDRQKLPS